MSRHKQKEAINEFFNNFTLAEAKEVLGTLLEVALTSDNDQYATPRQRDSVLHFCRQLQQLLEASHTLTSNSL